jgi:ArsR family transcriptional regulator
VASVEDWDNKRVFELHANICRTLSHPKRLQILNLLRQGELSVSEMAEQMGISLANASQHLAVLRDKEVVVPRGSGRAPAGGGQYLLSDQQSQDHPGL